MTTPPPSAIEVANALHLSPHVEGGYFKRTYQADHRAPLTTQSGDRHIMTSIYYMLTAESPVGHWHLNLSDIMHYYHIGEPIEYLLIHPDGHLQTVVMGTDVLAGQQLQLLVNGGIWKASRLLTQAQPQSYGLISEAVSPGFDFADMTIGHANEMVERFPQHRRLIEAFCLKTC